MARHSFAIAIFLATLWVTPSVAGDVTGRATVIDGDELDIAGQRISLAGIRAPAASAICGSSRCGQEATFVLAEILERHWVECTASPVDSAGHAICLVGGPKGRDVNAAMVSSGWAKSTDARYQAEESEARRAGRGLWQR